MFASWKPKINIVEAFAASWIEINEGDASGIVNASKPLRLRGLKFVCFAGKIETVLVEAFAASWIEMSIPHLKK